MPRRVETASTLWPRTTAATLTSALALVALASTSGCLQDTDCGICDEKNLVLQILSGPNYAGELIHIVSPECVGPRCPEPFTAARRFVERIGPCEDTDAAIGSARGPEEYCKIAPIVVSDGLQFVFNNLLEDTSIELVRKRPDVPALFEIYDWKTQLLELRGPVSRWAGDWRHDKTEDRDVVTRLVNHSCVANLRDAGIGYPFDAARGDTTALCDELDEHGVPRKLHAAQVVTATRGRWDDRAIGEAVSYDCETPAAGVDTCCSVCDHALGVRVAKYGAGERIACDPAGDRLIECAGFVSQTDRSDEVHCDPAEPECAPFELDRADAIRELHPDARQGDRIGAACESDDECRDVSGQGLPGAECIGTNAAGHACSPQGGDPECGAGRCRAPWFVDCVADPDTTGAQGYCVDVRHDADAAAACFVGDGFRICDANGSCGTAAGDERLSSCDANADGHLTAAECCPDGEACDPVYDSAVEPLIRYERKATLPSVTRELNCGDTFAAHLCDGADCCDGDLCEAPSGATCRLSTGSCDGCTHEEAALCAVQPDRLQTCASFEDAGDYAVNLVTKLGGIIYDPALKGIKWLPADRGGRPRAVIEACAESRGRIAPRNVADGWRAHDGLGLGVELEADWDLGLCSDQTYTVVFATDAGHERLKDKPGNTLAGKSEYTFQTPAFHVVPNSGFPADNLRIGPCDTFSLSFSNKYDLSPGNLAKIELHRVDGAGGVRVAGGRDCANTRAEIEAGVAPVPCLQTDVSGHERGEVHVRIDPVAFGPWLEDGVTYRMVVPGLHDGDDPADPSVYASAFWDVCGMPLQLGGASDPSDYDYTFAVDPTRCDEDEDRDGITLSCDNAPDLYNPEQFDVDGDGVGDAIDLCPASPGFARDTGDSDRDGIGNACDACAKPVSRYNELAVANAVPAYMQVRAVPSQDDADRDGVGDVCDNCPATANCGVYGDDRPYRLDDPLDVDAATCQRDVDADMIGDACFGTQDELAAGPVGYGDGDDFDQDGLANLVDACPRQPERDRVACEDDAGCPVDRSCVRALPDDATGVCNHADADGDGVGDACDTCPAIANAMQTFDGGAQVDDPDGDFVGAACELDVACGDQASPRPLAFYAVAAAGQCCTTLLVEQGTDLFDRATMRRVEDSDGLPIRRSCDGDDCRALPAVLAATPGVLVAPAGCDDALAGAGVSLDGNVPVGAAWTSGDLDALWRLQCRLPTLDQDFDGLGDACDLCPFAFDPDNEPYTDEAGKLWPNDGAACSGANSPQARCSGADDPADGGATDDGGSSDGG
ncbi:MAG: thrombospondin type 3 repeat-containing protein [Deltaproteobacteria bacterium]|nr:thrombospondin type 3 repeat-containing protein [Deltaproteobacteria bacterium]